MKKITFATILAVGLTSGMALTASANDGAGVHVSYESGVKVYRAAPTQLNHQVAATYKALELQERQIDNQNRLATARLNAETRLNTDRLALDRRIAFTNNEIFSDNRSRNGRRFINRGFNNRGFNRGFNNRFYGVNGISRNTRISRGFD